ncbi:DNA-binding domain-containing protein [Archangium primigenium]|uniref:HvfC/BufC N-terminal domain-containing protein n=1 Tax=[Archangium] primigenium TaxID=2792470 RepID=UPI00195D3EAD|nr:putative DNA-binding domain-containing protein [Archangium primigenium]MBM7117728.1 putative DNA-binding domain-containing protein [Archangium primigenium]
MKPGLRGFFDTMEAYFTDPAPEALERLYAAHPGWDAPRARVALYGQMVRHHGDATLDKLFPRVRGSVDAQTWAELVRDYAASRPARPFEMNQVGAGFPDFVADAARTRTLPDFLPALARFEWTDFAVYLSREAVPARVERLTVNPTLAVLEHPFQLCAWLRRGGDARPAPGAEVALLWRHPVRLVTMYLAADDRALLVLKMALEGLTPEQVAAATGVDVSHIHAAVEERAAEGLVLRP